MPGRFYLWALSALLTLSLLACSTTNTYDPNELRSYDPNELRSYARLLTDQLMASGAHVRSGERVLITTPAWLHSDLQDADLIALQIQESLMAEVHRAQLQVVEFKLTEAVRVTAQGDFPLSRNYRELRGTYGANYVLAATVVQRRDGVTVNARLIEFTNQRVAATAEVTIPQGLIDKLRYDHGIELVAR